MNSWTVKAALFAPKLPPPSTSTIPVSGRPSISFPRKINDSIKGRLALRVRAYDSSEDESASNSGDSKPPSGSLSKTRRDILLENANNVQPEFMELFGRRAPQQNAQHRLELQQSLEQVGLPDTRDKKDEPDYAPETQKNVSGEVIRWNNVSGPEKIDAKKYIELFEAEIEELNRQVGRKSANGQNELLEYLKTLEPQNLKELTSSAGEDVVLAMNTFIKRLLAVADSEKMNSSITETSAPELAKLLYWLMVVGYSICNIEVRFDMERLLGTNPKLAELPPGENI